MLISLNHGFVIVCPTKTGSTSIVETLSSESEISIQNTEFGKHSNLKFIENRFGFLLDHIRNDLKVISVVRRPHSRLESLYRSHYSEEFRERKELFTGAMSVDDFLEVWCLRHAPQIASTYSMCLGLDNQFAADYLINFENLETEFQDCMKNFNLKFDSLPKLNVSSELDSGAFNEIDYHKLSNLMGGDDNRLLPFTGRFLTSEEKEYLTDGISY